MAANPKPWVCPLCLAVLADESVRLDRPFSCQSCEKVIEHRRGFGRTGCLGCLGVGAILTAGLAALGLASSASVILGFLLAVLLLIIATKWTEKHRPPRRVLGVHEGHIFPDVGEELLQLLDQAVQHDAWNPALEKQRKQLWESWSRDDWLEDASLEAIDRYRSLLLNEVPKTPGITDVEVMREELRSIATDLRRVFFPK